MRCQRRAAAARRVAAAAASVIFFFLLNGSSQVGYCPDCENRWATGGPTPVCKNHFWLPAKILFLMVSEQVPGGEGGSGGGSARADEGRGCGDRSCTRRFGRRAPRRRGMSTGSLQRLFFLFFFVFPITTMNLFGDLFQGECDEYFWNIFAPLASL